MSSHLPDLRQHVARELIATTGTSSPHPVQLAAAFNTLCVRLRKRLDPLFGPAVTAALLERALDATLSEFQWMSHLVAQGQDRCALEGLTLLASDVTDDHLREALAAVLARKIELLGEFVGMDLALPLVRQAWGTPEDLPDAPT